MDKTKQIAQTSQLNKQLATLLSGFEKNKGWTDIGTWLFKVEQAMKENPSPFITEKLALAKRLAQCLNPMLPQTVNQQSLKIYELIFENIKIASSGNIEEYKKSFCEDIGIYSVGLFPFFQTDNQKNKHYYLEIIRNYYIPVGRDLIPSLPGLVLSILPGLQEQSEILIKDVTKTLEAIMAACGRRYFIGCVWMGIMRSERGREHAIKFLMKQLPKVKYDDEEEEDDESGNDSDFSDEDYSKYDNPIEPPKTETKPEPIQQVKQQTEEEIQENKEKQEGDENNAEQESSSLKQLDEAEEPNPFEKYNNSQQQIEQPEEKKQSKQQLEEEIYKNTEQEQITKQTQQTQQTVETQAKKASEQKQKLEPTTDQKKVGKSALELAFQHEVAPKLNKKQDFNNTFFVRDNLKYIEDDINENNNEINFPNKSTLIINTILSCFEDEKQIVKRNILDLMHQHLRINHPILSREDQLVLVEGVLYLLIRKDVSVTRRVNVWLFGKPDMENKYTITKNREFVIDLIIEAFQRIFNVEPTDQITAQQPLKIMQQFYMEHENLVELTLSKLSIAFVRYVYTHSQNIQFSKDVLKGGKRFMENIAGYINQLIRSIADEVIKLSKEKKDEQCMEIINLIDFTYDKLIDSNSETYDSVLTRDIIKETLSRLFISLSFFGEQEIREFSSIEAVLKVIYSLMLKLEKAEEQIKIIEKKPVELTAQQKEIAQYLDECSEKYFIFYGKLSTELEKFKSNSVYKVASQSLVKMQKFLYDKKKMTELPQWFKCISQSIKITNPNISLIAIESMIEIMISERIDPIYEQLKVLIIEEAKLKYSKNEIVAGNDYTKLTLEKLWSLLDFQHFYDRIIDLIIYFSKYFPQYFKEVVVNSFQAVSITEKEAAIRRFAVFWRLTANHRSKSLLSELNKVGLFIMLDFLDHDNPLIRHASKNWLMESIPQFFRIIDPLFEVLLQVNTSWYVTDSYQVFYTKIYETNRANETFRKLKSVLVIASDIFLKYIASYELSPLLADLKNHFSDKNHAILIRRLGATMSYFSTINPNSNVIDPSFQLTASQKPDTKKVTEYKMSYLDLLIIVCLRYIQGQALESLSLKFQVENAAVNASACEFLELLITHLEDAPLCLALCEYLMEPLLTILGHCITNRDYVMQVQLLNVFRIIFFHSSYIKKNNIEEIRFKLVQTLSNRLFIPNILKGLMTSIPYVRSQFISFISACIPLLSTYLVSNQLTSIIKQIMFTYFSLIKHLATTPASENDDSMVTISKTNIIKQPSLIKQNKTVILIQTEEQVKEDSNIYEIHTVLEGVRTILQFYLKIRTLEEIESTKKQESGGFMDVMKSVLTLGIAGGSANDKDKDGMAIFEKYTDTCKSLLYDIKQVVELFINSWQTTPEFISEFTIYGIRPYEQKKYNSFNNLLLEMIKTAENDKQRVKILIISIIKPLVYEFPKELMNSFLVLWNRQCALDPPTSHTDFHQNEFLKKMIEMMTILNIPNELFLESFSSSFLSEIIQKFYLQKNPKEKKGVYFLNYEIAQHESKMLYFLYIYLSYTYVDTKILQNDNLLIFWNQILKILKPSRNPNTVMWMLDLLYMLSEKYSPKEIIGDSKFKKELHDLINEKLMFLTGWVANLYQVKLNEPSAQTQQSLTNTTDQNLKDMIVQNLQSYKIVSPYPPTIYELSLSFYSQIHILEHAPKNIANKMKELQMNQLDQHIFDKIDTQDETMVIDKFKLFILETLKALSLELLQNTYSPERTDRVIVRVKEFVDPLYQVIDNKASTNMHFLESCSELICSLLEKAPALLIKDFKRNILETFNKDNFFSCNKTTLRYWGKIIDWVINNDKSSDLFKEYLEKVGLSAGFFAREQTENKRKIKSFKRICFIIFSGTKDKYANRLHTLLDRISDVIKQADSAHSSLLILILFCIRILIIRLSQTNLNGLFKQIWPILLTLLIQIYSKPLPGQPPRNPNLMLAGLKLIEILSVAQLDEFYLHQWMFIFDYFGLKLQPLSLQERENQQKLRGGMTEAQLRQHAKISPFYFQPFVSTCLNEQDLNIKYINQKQDDETGEPATFLKKQRKLVMTQCKVDDESELKNHALALCQYLISNNEHRTEVDFSQVEALIEDDFINLDEFILKV